jgi:GNAT superfamily N-acetyltransferase
VIETRPAQPEDIDAIAALAAEMDHYYGSSPTEPIAVRRQQVNTALFGTPPAAHALLAIDSGSAAGFATYSFLWPAVGLTRSLYLKELFVTDTRRRDGVGTQLMQAVLTIASNNQCSRVEWTADDDNPAAQHFYKALGFKVLTSKRFHRAEIAGGGPTAIAGR